MIYRVKLMASLITICSKHDKIMELANCKGNETLEELLDMMSDIYGLARDARDDGQKIEDGLYRKKDIIEKLESELEEANNNISNLESEIESLNDQIKELELNG